MDNTQRLAYSPLECAALIGVSKNLIYEMINHHQIKSIRGMLESVLSSPLRQFKSF
jgi:hypothetical protein